MGRYFKHGKDLIAQVLNIDNLYDAWYDVKQNRGAPGGDFITLFRFERRLELNLLKLAERVQTGIYQPGKVRIVNIRTGIKDRQIAIWCVADRVLQRAVLNVIEPTFEKSFLPCSFGYRPNRCVGDAVAHIIVLRENGYTWIVDADIRDCFPSLDHELILLLLKKRIMDQNLMDLISLWLPFGRPRITRRSGLPRGISLGSVISPLLCNIYLHELDCELHKRHLNHVRYADDFIVLCTSREERDEALETIGYVVDSLRLEVNGKKTHLTSFEKGFTFLGVTFKDKEYSYNWRNKRVVASDMSEDFPLEVDGYR